MDRLKVGDTVVHDSCLELVVATEERKGPVLEHLSVAASVSSKSYRVVLLGVGLTKVDVFREGAGTWFYVMAGGKLGRFEAVR